MASPTLANGILMSPTPREGSPEASGLRSVSAKSPKDSLPPRSPGQRRSSNGDSRSGIEAAGAINSHTNGGHFEHRHSSSMISNSGGIPLGSSLSTSPDGGQRLSGGSPTLYDNFGNANFYGGYDNNYGRFRDRLGEQPPSYSSIYDPNQTSYNHTVSTNVTRVGGMGGVRTPRFGDIGSPRRSLAFQRGRAVGSGGFGTVYQAILSDGTMAAVKELKVESTNLKSIDREILAMSSIPPHPNCVRYFGSRHSKNHYYIIMEYISGGSVHSLRQQVGAFRESVFQRYAYMALLGLEHLHRHGIVHRDIKGANVLLDERGCAKIVDFGCCKVLNELHSTVGGGGTPLWMAPEVCRGETANEKSDVWSFGCLCLEMTNDTGLPWSFPPGMTLPGVAYAIACAKNPPPIPPKLTPLAQDFMACCLHLDPEERLTVSDLLEHPFFDQDYTDDCDDECLSDTEFGSTVRESAVKRLVRNAQNGKGEAPEGVAPIPRSSADTREPSANPTGEANGHSRSPSGPQLNYQEKRIMSTNAGFQLNAVVDEDEDDDGAQVPPAVTKRSSTTRATPAAAGGTGGADGDAEYMKIFDEVLSCMDKPRLSLVGTPNNASNGKKVTAPRGSSSDSSDEDFTSSSTSETYSGSNDSQKDQSKDSSPALATPTPKKHTSAMHANPNAAPKTPVAPLQFSSSGTSIKKADPPAAKPVVMHTSPKFPAPPAQADRRTKSISSEEVVVPKKRPSRHSDPNFSSASPDKGDLVWFTEGAGHVVGAGKEISPAQKEMNDILGLSSNRVVKKQPPTSSAKSPTSSNNESGHRAKNRFSLLTPRTKAKEEAKTAKVSRKH